MNKVGHKIILVLILSVAISSLGGAWFAMKGFTSSKEDELLEKNAQVVLAVSNLAHLTNNIQAPELTQAISSYPVFGVGIVDTSTRKILISNGSLKLQDNHWQLLLDKKSTASVSSLTLPAIFLSVGYLDEGPLAVVATTSRTSAWLLVKEVFKSYLVLLLILTVIVVIIGALFARALVKPIEELTRNTELLSQGKWDLTPPTKTKDEIGLLSRAFLKMAEALQAREKTIKVMNEELVLSEKLAMIGQFSAGIAHEIKNPLASISTHLQLLERQAHNPSDQLPAKVIEKSELLIKEVDRANRIITDILGFSRQDKLHPVRTSMKHYLTNLQRELSPMAEARSVKLVCEWNGPDVEAEIDPEKLRQVFANLLSNSLDAMNEKTGTISWKSVLGNELMIEIRDDGPGIPEESRKKIFDPFYTSKAVGKGTGLGLSVCHGIMKQHGGSLINLPSETGAFFCLKLPLSIA